MHPADADAELAQQAGLATASTLRVLNSYVAHLPEPECYKCSIKHGGEYSLRLLIERKDFRLNAQTPISFCYRKGRQDLHTK